MLELVLVLDKNVICFFQNIRSRYQARSQDFLWGGAIRKKWTSGGAMGAPRTPIFNKKVDLINKKVDLSCLWGVQAHPSHPPGYGPGYIALL